MYLSKLNFVKQSVTDFLTFAMSPKTFHPRILSVSEKIAASFSLLILKFGFSILIAGLIGLFYEPKNLTDQALADRFSPLLYLLVGGMLLPLFEEVFFRLSLKFKPAYFILTSICGGYYFSTKFFYNTRLSAYDETFFYRIAIGIIAGLFCLFFVSHKEILEYLNKFWTQKITLIYYMSAVIFAWLHIFNFELTLVNLLLLPLLTLPQLFSGLIMGYMRLNFGFQYPLLFHMTTNSILVGLDIALK